MRLKYLVLGAALANLVGVSAPAPEAQAQDSIYVPLLTYRTGNFAGSGIPIANGMNDYLQMLNERDGGIGGSGCAGEEHLVVYAAGGMSGDERAALHAPLGACDPCISALTALHRRLSLAAVVDTPVPSGVQLRARLAFEAGLL